MSEEDAARAIGPLENADTGSAGESPGLQGESRAERPEKLKKAIFIDRDGTLIEEVGYLKMISDLRFTPGAAEALRTFRKLGYLSIVITNQSAVARGILSPKELDRIHHSLRSLARQEHARVDDILYCPHFAGGRVAPYNVDCECRKPKPGMLFQAREKYGIDMEHSYMVGDKPSDVELAVNAGVRPVLVLTGYGAQTRAAIDPGKIIVCANLRDFAVRLQQEAKAK